MGKNLYISEKPSVAASFGSVLGISISKSDRNSGFTESKDSIITWCFGHLITMAFPDAYDEKYKSWKIEHLPIVPDEYKYIVIDNEGVKKQFEVIKKLMLREDIDYIYSCTDSGREGEYIFRLVYNQVKCKIPVKRVWISSHTDEAIKDGIKYAKDISEYDNLSCAAYSRAKEDWLFGMNFSRAYTTRYGYNLANVISDKKSSVISIGRVMTCVLGLIVDRENEIINFVPKIHYGIEAEFLSLDSKIKYKGKWKPKKPKKKDDLKDEENYISREEAEKKISSLKDKEAFIKKVEIKPKKENPPLLFNLAELQSEANKKFKLPVDKTLEIAQSLYEKKLISYPRTDSRVITTDVLKDLPKILNGLFTNSSFKNYIIDIKSFGKLNVNKTNKRYVDDSKVSDHYAIIPTYVTKELNRLDSDSKRIYELVVRRFLAAFYPQAVFNTVKVETDVGNEIFISNASSLKEEGWKKVYQTIKKKNDDFVKEPIHNLVKNEKCDVLKMELEEKKTKPPARYTDGSLIITMEKAGKFIEDEELREQIKTCGIGTAATRSGIIKKLYTIGHIKINPKTQVIRPEKKGQVIVDIVKKTAKDLLNPALTASWEKGLVMIENGEISENDFQEKLLKYINRVIKRVKVININL